ncbi:hypothetical protein, partial [Kaistella sp.]
MKRKLQKILILVLAGTVSVKMTAQKSRDTLKEKKIEEVVVTALGIKRQDKSLGYVAETVGAETFEET